MRRCMGIALNTEMFSAPMVAFILSLEILFEKLLSDMQLGIILILSPFRSVHV